MAAIAFDDLFDRIGRVGHIGYVLAGNQAAVPGMVSDLVSYYEGTSDLDLAGPTITATPSIPQGVVNPVQSVQAIASTTMVRMVQASVPSINSLSSALAELIRQMIDNSETVKTCTVSASGAAYGTNIGTGVLVLSTKRGDGLEQENLFAESLTVVCSADSYTGGAAVGREPFSLYGTPNTVGIWEYNYPQGSSANSGVNAVSSSQNAAANGNLLTNGDFEEWSTDPAPELSNWVLEVGTWGTDVLQSSTAYQGTYSVRFDAGATNSVLYQEFGDGTTGTSVTPTPLTSYPINFFARALAGTVAAGVLTIELTDDAGTVINDQQGTANSFTLDLTTLTTSWVAVNGVFRIPEVPPDVIRLRFRISTDLAGDAVLIDSAALAPFTAAYPGGFGWTVFSGATPFVTGDGYTVTASNNRGGASYLATFQALFDRLFSMRNLGLLLPSDASPTQPDTKITA